MIYLDNAWRMLFELIEAKRTECLIVEKIFLTPVLAEMDEKQQLELKEVMKQKNFIDLIIWQ